MVRFIDKNDNLQILTNNKQQSPNLGLSLHKLLHFSNDSPKLGQPG